MSMTVAEWIEFLGSYPSELRVVVDGYEDGYDDLSPDRMIMEQISLNTGTESWEGMHGDPKAPDAARIVDALILRRASH